MEGNKRFVFLGSGGLGGPMIGTPDRAIIPRRRPAQRNSVAIAFQPNYPD